MSNSKKNQLIRGFTLLEMMSVLAILSVLVGYSAKSVIQSSRVSQVKESVDFVLKLHEASQLYKGVMMESYRQTYIAPDLMSVSLDGLPKFGLMDERYTEISSGSRVFSFPSMILGVSGTLTYSPATLFNFNVSIGLAEEDIEICSEIMRKVSRFDFISSVTSSSGPGSGLVFFDGTTGTENNSVSCLSSFSFVSK